MGAVTCGAGLKHRAAGTAAGVLLLLLVSSPMLHAQRQYVLGTTVGVTGGGDNRPGFGSTFGTTLEQVEPFWGLFPSVDFQSRGPRSTFNLSYAFGWQKTYATQSIESQTHAASLAFNEQLSTRWTANISNSFEVTDDASTFYALRGVLPTPEGLTYFFYPVASDQTVRSNRTTVAFDHPLNPRSSLSFGGSVSLRNYGDTSLAGLSNQVEGGGSLTYTHKTSEYTAWNVSYNGSYYQFDQFSDAISNAVRAGVTKRVAENTSFGLSAGASQVRSRRSSSSYTGYEASASLSQTVKENLIQLSIGQETSTGGLGSLSKTRQASAGISRSFGRVVSFFANASVFDSKAILDNRFDSRGGSATANVGFAFSRSVSLHAGGQLQRYTKPVIYAFSQKRVFLSLQYTRPNLWRSR